MLRHAYERLSDEFPPQSHSDHSTSKNPDAMEIDNTNEAKNDDREKDGIRNKIISISHADFRLFAFLFCLFVCLHEKSSSSSAKKSKKSKQPTQITAEDEPILENFENDIERFKSFDQSGVGIICCRNFLIAKHMVRILDKAEFGIIQKNRPDVVTLHASFETHESIGKR